MSGLDDGAAARSPPPAPPPLSPVDPSCSVASIALIVTPFTIYTVAKELAHEHHEEGPAYPHMKVAHKRWPWTANCALFDIHCKKEWAAHH